MQNHSEKQRSTNSTSLIKEYCPSSMVPPEFGTVQFRCGTNKRMYEGRPEFLVYPRKLSQDYSSILKGEGEGKEGGGCSGYPDAS